MIFIQALRGNISSICTRKVLIIIKSSILEQLNITSLLTKWQTFKHNLVA